MFYEGVTVGTNLVHVAPSEEDLVSGLGWPRAEVDVMQYSGLQGENGEPIYEADILRDEGHIWIVGWKAPCFHIFPGPNNTMNERPLSFFWEEAEVSEVGLRVEVVGNLHENNQLLHGPKHESQ